MAQSSIMKKIFHGNILEEDIFPYPTINEESKEMGRDFTNEVDRFAQGNINSAQIDHDSKIPKEVLEGLAELGLCGLAVPEEHGGLALSYTLYARIFMQLAYWDGSVATTMGAHQSIGYRALINEGSKEQKEKWLPKLASGEYLAAFCLTEPSSGSDAFSIKTKATEDEDGNYIINGQKIWITNGGLADFYTVFCKTDEIIEGKSKERITAFIIEKNYPGISFGEKEKKMGIKGSETRTVFFDKVKVPKENIIGKKGEGFKVCLNVLNSGRLSLGSGAVGGMKKIIELAVEHANVRKQFGKNLNEFGIIQQKIATMHANTYAVESLVFFITGKIEQGMDDYSLESAACKIFGSEKLWETVDMGLQIAAGIGYMQEYPYERLLRDSRINLIFEGTNEILRILVALNGFKGPSKKLYELGKLADISSIISHPLSSLELISDFAWKRIDNIIGTKSLDKTHPKLETETEYFLKMIQKFAVKVENILISEGKKVIENEFIHAKISDMAISILVSMAIISRTTALLNSKDLKKEEKDYVLNMARINLKSSRACFVKNFKLLDKNKNLDKCYEEVSKYASKIGKYNLDIL